LKYVLLVNDKKVLEEDIANWNQENKLSVFNLNKNDSVKVQVKSMKNIDAFSWVNASSLYVTYYEEIEHYKNTNMDITATSPSSTLYNRD